MSSKFVNQQNSGSRSSHTQEFNKSYVIDDEAAVHGHYVLRLPPYHCELNPIEMISSILKPRVRGNNNNPKFSTSVIAVITNQVKTVGQNEWFNCVKKVVSIEDEHRKRQVSELVIQGVHFICSRLTIFA